jgi:hypothetical protein
MTEHSGDKSTFKKVYKLTEKQRTYNREYLRQRNLRLRLEALAKLGGRCVNCGIDDIRVLQIDHIAGGGMKELKKMHYGAYHENVIAEARNNKYQLLCANCNWIKRHHFKESSSV